MQKNYIILPFIILSFFFTNNSFSQITVETEPVATEPRQDSVSENDTTITDSLPFSLEQTMEDKVIEIIDEKDEKTNKETIILQSDSTIDKERKSRSLKRRSVIMKGTGAIYIDLKYKYCEIFVNNVSYGKKSILIDKLNKGKYAVVVKRTVPGDYSDYKYIETANVRDGTIDTVVVYFSNPYKKGTVLIIGGVVTAPLGIYFIVYSIVYGIVGGSPFALGGLIYGIPLSVASAIMLPIGFSKLKLHKMWERENLISISPTFELLNDKYGLSLNVRF